jgi:uncharacterized membrane protein YsdA (DUF1294 family)/cold shock CspA family protein
MRFEGTIKSWNDERGFGFIEPALGGDEVFVHIKAFAMSSLVGGRPRVGQRVSFEVELGPKGKKRARLAALVSAAPKSSSSSSSSSRRRSSAASSTSPAQWGTATLFAIPAFLVLALVVGVLWKPPAWLALVYVGLSVVTFLAYAMDKSAAVRGQWRTPESTLHTLSLAGGWPGALLAQQYLRHKSTKAPFRAVFWLTVLGNVVGFVWLASPYGRPVLDGVVL